MNNLLLVIFAYLLGSIPTSVWVSRGLYGIDIRDYGSGNAGATNTFRMLGVWSGIGVFTVDVMKGWAAVEISRYSQYAWGTEQIVNLQIVLGLCAVLGHIFPIFARFKGGKGIATLFGMILAIHPIVAASLVVVFALMLFLTRYVSLSSIVASMAFPVLILFIFKSQATEISYKIFAIGTACLVVFTHHKNIGRLLSGNENKVNIRRRKN